MSDYLRGVVTRVLAPSRLLQPRVPTPFESSAPMSADVHVGTPAAMATSISASRRTTAIPRREIRGISPAPDVAAASVRADDASVDRVFGARPVVSTHVPAVTQSETSTSIGSDPFEDPVARSIFAPTSAAPASTAPTSTAPTATAPPIAATEPPIARPVHSAVIAPAEYAIERTSAVLPAASSDPTIAPPFAPRPRIASIPSVGRLPVTRRRDRAHEESRVTTAQTPIEITIGRIDVRAVVANSPAPAKPRARAQVMSLDDYLAMRGGGE